MLVSLKSSQDINLFEKNQSLWVFIYNIWSFDIIGFTVIHEMTINIKSVDKIGYLVDKILSKAGITLKNF